MIATLYFYRRTLAANWRSWLVVLPVLRLAAIGILLLVLVDATVVWSSAKPPVVTVIYDQSPSMLLKDITGNRQRLEWSSEAITRALSGKSFDVNSVTLNGEPDVEIDKTQSDAVVFVTDGYPSPNIDSLPRVIQSTNKPVYGALVPQQKLGADIGIDRVDAPSTFSAGVPAFFTVAVHALNAQGSETLLTVNDAAGVLGSRRVKFATNAEVQTVTLPVTESVSGLSTFQVKASSLDHEVNTANNEYSVAALVEEKITRILLFESQPSWEAKFFRRAFDNNTTVHVDYFVQVSRAATVAQPTDPSSITELHQILADRTRLFSYDAIVVGATDAAFLNATESRNVRDFVDLRGGGLMVLGSNNYSGSIVAPSSPLATMLPATIDAKTLAGERTISTGVAPPMSRTGNNLLALTQEGERSSALSLLQSSDAATSGVAKTNFGDSFIRTSSVRATAHVLAELHGSSKQVYPAIIAGDYGEGRVILLMPNDLYRISFATGSDESLPAKLWQGLAYYSAAKAKPPIYSQVISENGQSTDIEMIVRDAEYKQTGVEQISATLTAAGDRAKAIPIFLRSDNNTPGRFTAIIENQTSGPAAFAVNGSVAKHSFKYEMLLNAKDSARPFRLISETREKLSLIFRPDNMIDLNDATALAKKLESVLPKGKSSESRYRLIDHYLPLFLVLLVLSVEFFLRRKSGIE